ncbi:YdcF family protein [Clostridium weizhouense]|uniref:YdcF family protein n=1 Tax=Clostridium weizhouense TaxID=2859781 RepID=A0ABS7AR77_9CLOT|nr:YdcF family protein [Clostridium weizhouense]MBW6411182.1 YdcF family protein [Clostridium weizhouense]
MKEKIAENINILGKFCGKRDISMLASSELKLKYGLEQVDVMVLFGGSILTGGDILAEAMKNRIAKKYVIVGGQGHTTESLRIKMHSEFPEIETSGLPEAKVFAAYLKYKYDLEPDLLECKSTNCGNNITYLLDLLKENNVSFKSIILSQDATMQNRMEAGLRKYISKDNIIINYAVYDAEVLVRDDELEFKQDILGMWNIERYITLLMGEIPRLSDDSEGYGPNGKNYIQHVEIPIAVRNAFMELKQEYGSFIREANPIYSS